MMTADRQLKSDVTVFSQFPFLSFTFCVWFWYCPYTMVCYLVGSYMMPLVWVFMPPSLLQLCLILGWSLHGLTPPYLSEDCQLVTDLERRHLRSADVHTCTVPWTQTLLCDRSFAVAGPWLWNNLPVELRQRDICLSEFRRLLKTFLFCWDSAPCDFV